MCHINEVGGGKMCHMNEVGGRGDVTYESGGIWHINEGGMCHMNEGGRGDVAYE